MTTYRFVVEVESEDGVGETGCREGIERALGAVETDFEVRRVYSLTRAMRMPHKVRAHSKILHGRRVRVPATIRSGSI